MTNANIILVLGQSNAVGYATQGVAYPGGWQRATVGAGAAEAIWNGSQWVEYIAGTTGGVGDPNIGVCWGPEASIALAKRSCTPQTATWIVKYACGHVGMACDPSPSVNDWSPYSTNKMFQALSTALYNACSNLLAFNPPLTAAISECYWIGNESDCFDWARASSIRHDLPGFVTTLRTRFGVANMKLIIARTHPNLGFVLPYVDIVRRAQVHCADKVSRCAWVDCDDLEASAVSPGHYTPASVVTLGTRLAAAAAGIT